MHRCTRALAVLAVVGTLIAGLANRLIPRRRRWLPAQPCRLRASAACAFAALAAFGLASALASASGASGSASTASGFSALALGLRRLPPWPSSAWFQPSPPWLPACAVAAACFSFSAAPRMSPSERAAVGRTVLRHRLLLFGDLQRLDREVGLLRPVEADDLGVELLADLEALRTLLVAVAAEVGALDEAGRAVVADLDFEPAVARPRAR